MKSESSEDPERLLKVPQCSFLEAERLLFAVQTNDHQRIHDLVVKNPDVLTH